MTSWQTSTSLFWACWSAENVDWHLMYQYPHSQLWINSNWDVKSGKSEMSKGLKNICASTLAVVENVVVFFLSAHFFNCPPVHPGCFSACLSNCLSVYLSIHLLVCLPVHPLVSLPVVRLSVCFPVHPPDVCLSIRLFFCLPNCPSHQSPLFLFVTCSTVFVSV